MSRRLAMNFGRVRFTVLFAPLALCAVAFSTAARAGNEFSLFLEPFIGVTAATINSLEVENAFVSSQVQEGEDDPTLDDDWTTVDPSTYKTPVGRKAYYSGKGLSLGAALGIRLFAVQLGVSYIHDGVDAEGFSKRYRYSVDKMRATGRRFNDAGVVQFHRIVALVRYILPFWMMQLELSTRIGGVYLDEGPLIVGRAIENKCGFAGDLGVGLGFSPVKMLTLRATGFYGFYSFSGEYEGTYGMLSGFEFAIGLSI